jgi:hypothetical protein
MDPAPWSLRETGRGMAREWEKFFHSPADGQICAAVRIAYATIVLIHFAVLYPDLNLWFTDGGVLTKDAALKIASPYSWSLLAHLPSTPDVVYVCFWIAVAHAMCLLVGLLPRVNALLLFIWLVSFQVRNYAILDGQDGLMRVLGFFMIWLPSGRCWSVNAVVSRWWRGRGTGVGNPRPEVGGQRSEVGAREGGPAAASAALSYPKVAGWPLRLLQIEMAAMLFSSALTKLAGMPWVDGTALYYVSRLDDFFGRFPVPVWAFDTPWVVAALTWSVVVAEFFVPLLIWFKETRWTCLIVLVMFHLANEWTMNVFLFHWLMLCGWVSFLRVEDFGWITARRLRRNS